MSAPVVRIKSRAIRRAQALAFLRTHQDATALEIGRAAVNGEAWAARRNLWRQVESVGLELAIYFVKTGIAKPTRNNGFLLT